MVRKLCRRSSFITFLSHFAAATNVLPLSEYIFSGQDRPEKMYSENGKTFVAAAKWLRNVMKDERLHNFLTKVDLKWQFNLSFLAIRRLRVLMNSSVCKVLISSR